MHSILLLFLSIDVCFNLAIPKNHINAFAATLKSANPFLDTCIYEVTGVSLKYFNIASSPPNGGEKLFFGGFPLTQNLFTFHKGMVSSVSDGHFTVDGTVVAGHSGSPIVRIQGSEIHVVGILISEVTDLDEAFKRLERKLSIRKLCWEALLHQMTRLV